MAEEYEQKKSVDKYEKGERLDLEDNDPEYETEEYGGPDYDDRGIEHEEVQEEGEEIEEHEEEYIGDEGEGDMVEEEVEDVNEDLESEEDDDHVGEEHGQMVDEAEEDEHNKVVKERRKRKELEIFIDVVNPLNAVRSFVHTPLLDHPSYGMVWYEIIGRQLLIGHHACPVPFFNSPAPSRCSLARTRFRWTMWSDLSSSPGKSGTENEWVSSSSPNDVSLKLQIEPQGPPAFLEGS
nr:heterogeneous nuclear ribonucleoprotein R-like isoform X1 [Ipomoea batatas]